jgi:hypothetical protein
MAKKRDVPRSASPGQAVEIRPANIISTKADQASSASAPDLRLAIPNASQGHSAAVDPLPTVDAFSLCVQSALGSTKSSFPSASQGKVAAVGPVSTAATSHHIARRLQTKGNRSTRLEPSMSTATTSPSSFRLCAVSLNGSLGRQLEKEHNLNRLSRCSTSWITIAFHPLALLVEPKVAVTPVPAPKYHPRLIQTTFGWVMSS